MRVQTTIWLTALPMCSPTIEYRRQARGEALRLFRMLSHRVPIIVVLYGTAYRIRTQKTRRPRSARSFKLANWVQINPCEMGRTGGECMHRKTRQGLSNAVILVDRRP